MDDYAIVLNAGSSSLKFCVYRRPHAAAWRARRARTDRRHRHVAPVLGRGDGAGTRFADERLDGR